MRTKLLILSISILLGLYACKVDNYDAPDVLLEGNLMYNGKPVATKGEQMRVEIYETGWKLVKEIPSYVNQEGYFSQTLFKGNYKLYLKSNRGSFDNYTTADSVKLTINSSQRVDMKVIPFFFVNEPTYTVSGNTLTAQLKVDKVNSSKTIGSIRLVVGKTMLLDEQYNAKSFTFVGTPDLNNLSLSLDITELKSQGYCYARVVVGTQGTTTFNYSFSKKVTF